MLGLHLREDLEHLSDQDLETLHRIAAVFAAEARREVWGVDVLTIVRWRACL